MIRRGEEWRYEQELGEAMNRIGSDDTFDILRVRSPRSLEISPELPPELTGGNEAPDVPNDAATRTLELQGHGRINGEEIEMGRIDQVVPAGALERWIVSGTGEPHTFHIHGCSFHVLEVDGAHPEKHLRGPKDTVFIHPDRPVTLAVRFREYVDPEMPYMYHCHILRHEDNGMMGQFVMIEPGTEDSVATILDRHRR